MVHAEIPSPACHRVRLRRCDGIDELSEAGYDALLDLHPSINWPEPIRRKDYQNTSTPAQDWQFVRIVHLHERAMPSSNGANILSTYSVQFARFDGASLPLPGVVRWNSPAMIVTHLASARPMVRLLMMV